MMRLRHKTPVQTIGGHLNNPYHYMHIEKAKKTCLIHIFTAFQKKKEKQKIKRCLFRSQENKKKKLPACLIQFLKKWPQKLMINFFWPNYVVLILNDNSESITML